MDQNPPKLGINWASSLEVSFRVISWLWAFHFFQHSPKLNATLFTRALKYLYLHGRHLETYLSIYFSPNTHLTGEALGLYYLARSFQNFLTRNAGERSAERFFTTSCRFTFSRTESTLNSRSYYHRYTSDFYLHFLLLTRLIKILNHLYCSLPWRSSSNI
jgi:hypothetical protein